MVKVSDEFMERYPNGIPLTKGAEMFGLHRITLSGLLHKNGIPFHEERHFRYFNTEETTSLLKKMCEKNKNHTNPLTRETYGRVALILENGPDYKLKPAREGYTIGEVWERTKGIFAETTLTELIRKYKIEPTPAAKSEKHLRKRYNIENIIQMLTDHYKEALAYKKRALYIVVYCLDKNVRKSGSEIKKSLNLKGDNISLRKVASAIYRNKTVDEETAIRYMFQDFDLPEAYQLQREEIFKNVFNGMLNNITQLNGIRGREGGFRPLIIVRIPFEAWYKTTVEAYLKLYIIDNSRSVKKPPESDTWSQLTADAVPQSFFKLNKK